MIQELYLKKAAKIRKDYLSIVNDIKSYELVAKDLLNSLQLATDGLESTMEKIDNGSIRDSERDEKLQKIFIDLEHDMNNIEKSVNKLNGSMDKLRTDEIDLHKQIKQVYFNLSDEEIKKEVQDYLVKLKLV